MKRHNPATIAAPVGKYTHGIEVPPNARWLYIAGQVGLEPDGSIQNGIDTQARRALQNVVEILKSADMSVENLVRTNIYLVDRSHVAAFRAARDEVMGDHRPASTLVIVDSLVSPELLVEVEAIAAKA